MIFDPIVLAKGWLSVAVASGDDKFRPALHRSICIELHAHGIRLVATDSYILLRAWVPDGEHADAPEPDLDEPPITTAVAIDEHRRAKGLLEHLLKLGEEEAEEVRVTLGNLAVGAKRQPNLAGMDVRWVAIEHPGHERVELATYEGSFPNWRRLAFGFVPELTPAVALSNYVVAKLAKLTKLWAANALRVHFGGTNRMARIEVADAYPAVEGGAMPTRWDFDRNAPRVDATDEDGEDGEPDDEDEPMAVTITHTPAGGGPETVIETTSDRIVADATGPLAAALAGAEA